MCVEQIDEQSRDDGGRRVKWVQIAQPLPSDGAVLPNGDYAPTPEKCKSSPEGWLSVELEVVFVELH